MLRHEARRTALANLCWPCLFCHPLTMREFVHDTYLCTAVASSVAGYGTMGVEKKQKWSGFGGACASVPISLFALSFRSLSLWLMAHASAACSLRGDDLRRCPLCAHVPACACCACRSARFVLLRFRIDGDPPLRAALFWEVDVSLWALCFISCFVP